MITRENLPDWLDRHHVDIVRTWGTTLDGLGVGKYLHRDKFEKSLPSGHGISDLVMAADINGAAHLTHWHHQRSANFGDIQLRPDLGTLISDGTNPALGHCIGNFTQLDGTPLRLCPRTLLQRLVQEVADLGYAIKATYELEFFLFKDSYADLQHKGYEQMALVGAGSNANAYLIRNAYHATEFMTEVIKRMDWKGLKWEAWNDEAGKGQIELNLVPTDPVTAADNVIRTKQILYEVAVDLQMAVTFMAKPTASYGSGMHIHHSLQDSRGQSAFFDPAAPEQRSTLMRQWLGGLMATLPAAVSFLCPTVNSYRRFTDFSAVPMTACWGEDNRSAALRLISGSPTLSRIENRVGAADLNPYLGLSVILAGGLAGIKNQLQPPPEFSRLAWGLPDSFDKLPTTLSQAAATLKADTLLADIIGEDIIENWLHTRDSEWLSFHTGGGDPQSRLVSDWEYRRYFELI